MEIWALLGITVLVVVVVVAAASRKSRRAAKRTQNGISKSDDLSPEQLAIVDSASRLVDVVNESVKIAQESHNPETKVSRLGVAKDRLAQLKKLARQYPFIKLTQLQEGEALIAKLERDFRNAKYQELANGNMDGQELERQGKVSEAIEVYERLLADGADTPHTYRRLAIIYSKQKKRDEELRVLRVAVKNIPVENSQHYKWFAERLAKKSQ